MGWACMSSKQRQQQQQHAGTNPMRIQPVGVDGSQAWMVGSPMQEHYTHKARGSENGAVLDGGCCGQNGPKRPLTTKPDGRRAPGPVRWPRPATDERTAQDRTGVPEPDSGPRDSPSGALWRRILSSGMETVAPDGRFGHSPAPTAGRPTGEGDRKRKSGARPMPTQRALQRRRHAMRDTE